MAFVVKKKTSFLWPVKLKTPADGGVYEEHEIELCFKKIKASEIKALLEKKETTDIGFCKKIVDGWKGIQTEDGKEIEFNEKNFDSFLETFGFAKEIVTQYMGAISGLTEKN